MSINQLKKATAALRSHLGRDQKGLELLNQLSRQVHNLKASAAQAEESLAKAERVASKATEERDTLTLKLQDQKIQTHSLQQAVFSKTRQVENLSSALEAERGQYLIPVSSGDLLQDLTARRIYAWCKKTGRQLGTIKPQEKTTVRHPLSYPLDQILPSFDELGFATAGRVLVLSTLVNGAACISLPGHIDKSQVIKVLSNQPHWDRTAKEWLRVFKNGIDDRTDEEILRERTSGKCGWAPDDTGNTTAAIFGD